MYMSRHGGYGYGYGHGYGKPYPYPYPPGIPVLVSITNCKAISGYAFLVNGGAVSWSTKRQEIISFLMTESEYVAAVHAEKEALWLCSLISSLFGIDIPTTTLFSDNQSAITLTKEHQYHTRMKHIDVHFHFLRWIVEEGRLRLIYCPTDNMVADVFTKALSSVKVKHFANELGLVMF